MEQKLISIYLSDRENIEKKKCYDIKEHLQNHLDKGWKIISIQPAGSGGGDRASIAAWVFVILEHE